METLTAIGTVLGIAAFTFFRDWRDGKSLFKRNGTAEGIKMLREMRDSQKELQHHYNDETTELLREIRDGVNVTNTKLTEFDKYGLPTRK